jgi:hypothetical protein
MIEQPGDDSVFVNTARKVLLDCAPRLGLELDRTNFSFLCDKMARMFVPRFHDYVYRCEAAALSRSDGSGYSGTNQCISTPW